MDSQLVKTISFALVMIVHNAALDSAARRRADKLEAVWRDASCRLMPINRVVRRFGPSSNLSPRARLTPIFWWKAVRETLASFFRQKLVNGSPRLHRAPVFSAAEIPATR